MDPALTSGADLFAIINYFKNRLTPEKSIAPTATTARM
jgi:hypothetical protein